MCARESIPRVDSINEAISTFSNPLSVRTRSGIPYFWTPMLNAVKAVLAVLSEATIRYIGKRE